MRRDSFGSISGGDRFTCSRPALSGRIRHGDRAPWLHRDLGTRSRLPPSLEGHTEGYRG